MTSHSQRIAANLAALKRITEEVATPNAVDVDIHRRFPQETIQALQKEKILTTPVPEILGGAGSNLQELPNYARRSRLHAVPAP